MPTQTSNRFRDGASATNESSSLQFVIRRMLARVRTSTIVQVVAVYNDGDVTPVGVVDIQPLVQQTDSAGNVTSLAVVYGVPYMRVQGGTNAVILDPQVGDIGMAVFGDRDLSTVVATKKMGPPGSARQHNLSDALYIGGILNGTPQQYVQFTTSGITVLSPQAVTIQAPTITLQGNVHTTGTLQQDGAVTANSTITATGEVKGKGIPLSTHKHTGVQTGGGTSGPPTP